MCDRSDCYRAHHGTEPPPEVIDPNRFKPVGLGIRASERATFESDYDTEEHDIEQERTVSHSDPTSSAALRTINRARQQPAQGNEAPGWRAFFDPFQEPRTATERADADELGIDHWRESQAYIAWRRSRGDFGLA